jgi:hypothetical protein
MCIEIAIPGPKPFFKGMLIFAIGPIFSWDYDSPNFGDINLL